MTIEDIYIEDVVERRAFEFDGAITAGDSGAPIFGETGDVLGIVYARSRDAAWASRCRQPKSGRCWIPSPIPAPTPAAASASDPMILGFDVGGTNARALLIEPETGDIIDRDRESSAGTGPVLLETLVRMIDRMTRNHDGELEGVGLGVAGLAHRSGVIHYSPNLPDLVEYPLGTELAGRTGLDVTVMNDATAATWAEGKLGAGRGSDDYMLITLGTGIGSGSCAGAG